METSIEHSEYFVRSGDLYIVSSYGITKLKPEIEFERKFKTKTVLTRVTL